MKNKHILIVIFAVLCVIVIGSVVVSALQSTPKNTISDSGDYKIPEDATAEWERLMLENKSVYVNSSGIETPLNFNHEAIVDTQGFKDIDSASRGKTAIILETDVDGGTRWNLNGGVVSELKIDDATFQMFGRKNEIWKVPTSILKGFDDHLAFSSFDFFLVVRDKHNKSRLIKSWHSSGGRNTAKISIEKDFTRLSILFKGHELPREDILLRNILIQ